MADHHVEPGLEIFLHPLSGTLQKVLDALDLRLQLFQLIVLILILEFVLADLLLKGVFLGGLEYFTGLWVNEPSHGVLLADLLYLISQGFDLVA